MRSAFGKYLALCLIGIIVEVIVVIIVLIQTFRFTNGLAQSLFNIISNWTAALNTFSFIADWAEVLSAFAICLVIIAFFANFRKYRQNRAHSRLHDWAKNAAVIVADYRQRDSSLQESPLERYEEIRALINKLKANFGTILADAQVLGGELDINAKKAFYTLSVVDDKIKKQDDSAFEDLRTLQHNLADVMISAFESLQNERYTSQLVPRKENKLIKKDTQSIFRDVVRKDKDTGTGAGN